jgi:phytol kinase
MIANGWIALGLTFGLALLWLRLNDLLAQKGIISGPLSRKIIHMGTGPIFVLCWLFFPPETYSRYLAALVPLAISLQFVLVGLGVIKDEAAVSAMSRSGDRREILKGPLFYGIVFVLLTIFFWKENPIGIIALMLLCGGDGLADIVGKRVKSAKLPWSMNKTIAGTLSVFVGGWVFTVAVMAVYVSSHVFIGSLSDYLLGITVISIAGMIVESLPFRDIDNLTVPAVAILIGTLFFG